MVVTIERTNLKVNAERIGSDEMIRRTKKNDVIPTDHWYRSWCGKLTRVVGSSQTVSEHTRWMKYTAEDVKELIFVGDILRVREWDDEHSRGMLVEIEDKDDLKFYQSEMDYAIIELLTLDRSMAIVDYKVQWRSPEFKLKSYTDEDTVPEEVEINE